VVQRIREALAESLVRLVDEAEAGRLTEERLEALRESLDTALQDYRDQAVVVLEQGRQDAMELAVQGHTAGLTAVLEETGQAGSIAVAETFTDVPDRVLEVQATRRAEGVVDEMATLVNRSVQDAADDIDEQLGRIVDQGVDNETVAKDIARILARGNPDLQDTLEQMGRGTDVDVEPDADPVALDSEDLSQAKRLEYEARRIAVSETNSHYHEADVVAGVRSPVVDLLRWLTSQLHTAEKRYVPDVCDVMEEADLYGYGEGLFHPAAAPSLMHPHCQCRYETVLKDPEDYGTRNRDLPDSAEVSEGAMRDALNGIDGERSITDAYVSSQSDMLQEHVNAAEGVAPALMG